MSIDQMVRMVMGEEKMKQKKRYQPYEERFLKFSNKVERIMQKVVIIFFVLLFISQALLLFDFFRKILVPIEEIEGAITFEIDFTS